MKLSVAEGILALRFLSICHMLVGKVNASISEQYVYSSFLVFLSTFNDNMASRTSGNTSHDRLLFGLKITVLRC